MNFEDEARGARERLKAQERALFDLDRMPQEEPAPSGQRPAPRAAAQDSSAASSLQERPAAAPAGAPGAGGAQRSSPQGASSSSVYTPPTWTTRPATAGRPGDVVLEEDEGQPPLCGCGVPGAAGGSMDQQVFAMAGLVAPSDEAFEQFFRHWFATEYFPDMSQKLQKELVQRARSRSFFSGLASQFKKWAMANTDARLQADVWCAYFLQYAPPRFRTLGCMKTVTVNLGSQAQPLFLTFYGFPSSGDPSGARWLLPPWAGTDVDIGALVDELDGRGGMTALLTSAASDGM